MNWSKVTVRGSMRIGFTDFLACPDGVMICHYYKSTSGYKMFDYCNFISNSQFNGAERIRLPQTTTLELEEESPKDSYGYDQTDQQGERPGQEALSEDHQNGIQ